MPPSVYPPQFGAKTARAPQALGVALFAACLYAAFAGGAIRTPDEPRLQVGIALITIAAAIIGVIAGTPTPTVPRRVRLGVGLLAGFWAWSAVSLAWSASPDGTWVATNRVFAYLLVLILAVRLGASLPNAIMLVRRGALTLSLVILLYALGQKVAPGLHVGGLLNLDRTGQYARLQAPLAYWNALALAFVLGAPAALTLALTPSAPPRARLTGFIGLELIVVGIGFTESRGGFLALAVALAVTVLLSPDSLTTLIWAAVAVAFGALGLVIGLLAHPLTGNGVSLGAREQAGVYLGVVLVAVAVLSAQLLPVLDRLPAALTRPRRRRLWRSLGYGSLGLIAVGLIGAGVSHRGLGGQISHLWQSFTNADTIATSGAGRLLSASSANRIAWWGQALAAFSHRPLGGWGAGSFPVLNLLYRHSTVAVQDAHSVPLQWLAETGLIGTLLAVGAWGTLLRSGVAAVRRAGGDRVDPTRLDTDPARRRLAAIALLAPAFAYTVHALYDWDWNIPGVTLPVIVMLGVLAGSLAGPGTDRPTVLVVPPPVTPSPTPSAALRLLGLAAITLGMSLYGISAVLPGAAAADANAALVRAAAGTPAALRQARAQAARATALDPLSGAGPLAAANIAVATGELGIARDDLLEAIQRQPTDEPAWVGLAHVDLQLNRDREALVAITRALALDPELGVDGYLSLAENAIAANRAAAPPAASPTAIPTP
ncbi:O-antigen ligase family protein [Conexibacter sp. DBS9H8]|uniref:O-antigen ligase family protein n=1 Tax=Conexibacter sp. DBS9H8 TaxID=2937801 RepID=UPI00200DA775|nr:O-antigen ligase family protein [Conexibacter sp. DBS9H8]